jgi:hypothetical protein
VGRRLKGGRNVLKTKDKKGRSGAKRFSVDRKKTESLFS